MDLITALFFVLGANFVLSFAVAALASSKGRSFVGYLLLSWITSFFIGLIVVALLPKLNSEPQFAQSRCEFCGESVLATARVCKHCTRDIRPNMQAQLAFDYEKTDVKKRKSWTAVIVGAVLVIFGSSVPSAGFWIFFGLVSIGLGVVKYVEASRQAALLLAKPNEPNWQSNS